MADDEDNEDRDYSHDANEQFSDESDDDTGSSVNTSPARSVVESDFEIEEETNLQPVTYEPLHVSHDLTCSTDHLRSGSYSHVW